MFLNSKVFNFLTRKVQDIKPTIYQLINLKELSTNIITSAHSETFHFRAVNKHVICIAAMLIIEKYAPTEVQDVLFIVIWAEAKYI